jgi:nicotinamidase-related amidase
LYNRARIAGLASFARDDAGGTKPALSSLMPRGSKQNGTALVLIDLINPFDFPGADRLFARALPAAQVTGALQARAQAAGVPVIHLNEMFGYGASDQSLRDLVAAQARLGGCGQQILETLPIDVERDRFVAKPMHSGFFRTGFESLLQGLAVDHLILTGVAADICVLATAFDAHMRGIQLTVPCDCVAAESAEAELWALRLMERVFGADVRPSLALRLPADGPPL